MSRVRADRLTNKEGTGAPTFPNGAVITGVATATSFSGNATSATSATTATTATNAQGLTGTPNIVVGSVTGTTGTFSGAVSGTTGTFSGNVSIGGTLTYEDVTNIDSIGIITARAGVNLNGLLREEINITAGKLSDNLNINVDNGMIYHFTTQETTTSTPNIMSSVGINTQMGTGEVMAVTIITTTAPAGYSTSITIDGVYNDVKWSGGADPSAGGASGNDVYALQVIKTGSSAYTVLGALNNFA